MSEDPRLYPEDQQKVDAYLKRGYNSTERKPFRPMLLMLILFMVVSSFSVLAIWLAGFATG